MADSLKVSFYCGGCDITHTVACEVGDTVEDILIRAKWKSIAPGRWVCPTCTLREEHLFSHTWTDSDKKNTEALRSLLLFDPFVPGYPSCVTVPWKLRVWLLRVCNLVQYGVWRDGFGEGG